MIVMPMSIEAMKSGKHTHTEKKNGLVENS